MTRRLARRRAGLTGCVLIVLLGCGREPDPGPDSGPARRNADSTPQATEASEASGTSAIDEGELAKFAPFPLDEAVPIPWGDTTLFSNPSEEDFLLDSLHGFWKSRPGPDTVLFGGDAYDSLSRKAMETLDFRRCDGNEVFRTLDRKQMDKELLLGSPPREGFTYRIAGKGGELITLPLRFDSMQAQVYLQIDEDTVEAPLWRISTGLPAADDAIGTLRGQALVIGSRQPLRNSPIRPAPLADSLKLLCLNGLVPDPKLLNLLSNASFYSAGGDGERARYIVSLRTSRHTSELFAVELAEGRWETLFRLNASEHGDFLNCLSISGSPLADVFFVRIYETLHAILPFEGKWISVGVESTDRFNTGC